LILEYTIADNLILGQQHQFSKRGLLDLPHIAAHAAAQIGDYDIRPPNATLPARALSGGNQQKIVIAREMSRAFSVLLAAQPTRGVDVGAIEFIHSELMAARDKGKAVLLVSADLVEVLALADRIAVMYGGRIAVIMPRETATAEVLGPYMTGAMKGAA
jgi:simple sugar transport system ATP-binding protein